jgi:Tfp pilus assembly protein PilV
MYGVRAQFLSKISMKKLHRICTQIQSSQGYSLVEVLLGVSLISIIVISFSTYYVRALRVSTMTTQHIQSSFLLEEGVNAVKTLRDRSWKTYIKPLSTSTTYYLSWTTSGWVTTTTPQWVEQTFLRSFVVQDLFRDTISDDITSSGGVYASTSKRVSFTVAWLNQQGTSTESIDTNISNLFMN